MGVDQLYLLRVMAERRGLSPKTLRSAIRAQRLRAIRLTPGITSPIYLRDRDVDDWIEAGAQRQLAPRRVR